MPIPHDIVEQIFHQAVEIDDSYARNVHIDRACGKDLELRKQVHRMLTAHSGMGSFLETPAVVYERNELAGISEGPGTVIGSYKLLQQVGEGGMGIVFMAEQQTPVQRKVALKVIKPGFDSRRVIARFEAERQALALMDHPNIAKVLDAGTSQSGRPYFVMELIRGIPITQYCDANRLSFPQRLDLFVTVCHAVQHAHQKGVIHRDLKPSNVLVSDFDDRPVPRIIDFGVAKAIGQQLTEKTLFTEFGMVIGTLEYMSPEQAKLNQLDVDTRTDVYSLGVLLYELMTGTTPLDREQLANAAFDEVLRTIRDEEPPRPSARLSVAKQLPTIAARRSLSAPDLVRAVRGDLDWIVMKALHKDRNMRYESAGAFAADLTRFVANEPVTARPPSATYQLVKFVQRYRRSIAAITTIVVAVLIGIGGIAAGVGWAIRDRTAREEQESREQLADQMRAESQIDLIFRRVQELSEKQHWDEAWSTLQRAEAIIKTADVPARLVADFETRKKTLEFVRQLNGIWSRSDSMLGKRDVYQPRYVELDRSYGSIFEASGLDLVNSRQLAVATIEKMDETVRDEVVAAVDDWLVLRSLLHNGDPSPQASFLDALDSDPWRSELRSAIADRDREKLERFAHSDKIAEQSISLLGAVALALRELNIEAERDFLRRLVDLHPSNYYLKCRLAESLLFLSGTRSDVEEGLGHASTLRSMQPDSTLPLSLLALGNIDLGHAYRADPYIDRLLRMDPHSMSGEWLASRVHYQLGSYGTALECLQRAIDLAREKDPYACQQYCYEMAVNLAFLPHSQLRDPRRALAVAQLAHELAPIHPKSFVTLAVANYGLENWARAVDWGQKATELEVTASTAQRIGEAYYHPAVTPLILAACNWRLGKTQEAQQYYERGRGLLQEGHSGYILPKALQIDVEHLMSHDLTVPSLDHAARGNWDLALRSFNVDVSRSPDDNLAQIRLATLLAYVDDTQQYRSQCQAIISRFGTTDDPLIAERTARVCLLAPGALGELAEVSELLNAVERAKSQPEWFPEWFALTKGLAELRHGRFDAAIEWLKKSDPQPASSNRGLTSLSARDAAAHAAIAIAEFRRGSVEEARIHASTSESLVLNNMPNFKLDPHANGDSEWAWYNWIHARILLREAKELLRE